MPLRTGITSLLLLSGTLLHAQQRDTVLGEVSVKGTPIPSADTKLNNFSAGQQVATIDPRALKLYSMQSMASLLEQQMPVFVKAYSFNGLATLGFRGSSAAQSQVFWNGVPIQNAALGVADVSALPVLLVSRANVVYGGSGALFGSGNVGGALMLENDRPKFDTGYTALSISGAAGSFGQYSGGLKGALGGKKWYLSATAFAQTATNNYRYENAAGTLANMPNSNLQSGAVMAHAAYRKNTYNTFELSAWAQQYDRRIPPALFEPYSAKHRQDRALRTVANWQYAKGGRTVYARTSFINDAYAYEDAAVQLATKGTVYQYFQEVGWKQRWDYSDLLLFAPAQVAWMPLSTGGKMQSRAALAGAYSVWMFKKRLAQRLRASVQARAEQINDIGVLLPGAGVVFGVVNGLQLRANVQRTYRVPTLNELYYFPGGNPGLKPEHGWSEDAGYTVDFRLGRFSMEHDASIFNRNIHNWITWLGGAIWTPYNIATVHSRGIETNSKITSFALGNWRIFVGAGTSYILSTTTSSYMPGDGSIGKQIPYTPRYNLRGNAGFMWKEIYFSYNHAYTGYRFTTTDESSWLEPYSTGNILLAYTLKIHGRQLELNGQCNNIWNAHYSVAGFRPMPGINWLAGIRLHL